MTTRIATLSAGDGSVDENSEKTECENAIDVAETREVSESQAADVKSLQEEIKKLHEQLASSKSEAWRYKRQLLKQFL